MFYFKNLFGGACRQIPLLSSSSLRHSQGALRRQKSRVRCFQNYVRYFKNLSKTLQYDFFLLVVRGVILSVTLRRAHEACDMASQANAKTKPSTRSVRYFPFLFENAFFFPPISPTVHLYSVKTITESRIFSKTLSRVKIFENAGHSFTCGQTKTQVFEYDDVMHHLPLA